MKKFTFFRKMQFFAAAIVLFCAAMMPVSSKAINATVDNPILFSILGSATGGEIQYSIIVVDVFNQNYQSMTITYPSELNINYAVGFSGVWNITNQTSATTKSTTFITAAGQSARTAAQMKTDLGLIYFTLAIVDEFPPDESKVSITAFPTKVTFYQDDDGYAHWYEYVKGQIDWLPAYNAAKGKTMRDPRYPDQEIYLQGYLATITSQEEQRQVYTAIATECGWLGGTRMVHNIGKMKLQDLASVSTNTGDFDFTTGNGKEWYWACGPEAWTVYDTYTGKYTYYPKGWTTVPSGTMLSDGVTPDLNVGQPVVPLVFWKTPTYVASPSTDGRPTSTDGTNTKVYANWNNPFGINVDGTAGTDGKEPNNSSNEYVVQFAYTGKDLWNDYSNAYASAVLGYYVEYGGYPDDPKVEELGGSDVTTSSEVDLVLPVIIQYRSTEKNSLSNYQQITSIGMARDTALNYEQYLPYTADRDNTPIAGYTPYGYDFYGQEADRDNLTVSSLGDVSGYFSKFSQRIVFLFKPNTLTVFFNANFDGCSNADLSATSKTVFFDSPYGVLPDATRKGYIFDGWYTTDGLTPGDLVESSTMVTSQFDHILYASWIEQTGYSVKYDLNGATSPTSLSDKTGVSWSDDNLLPAGTVSRTGYILTGWNVSINGSKQGVINSDTYGSLAFSDGDDYITLQAQWISNDVQYVVIYHTNGSTNPTSYSNDTLTSVNDYVDMPTLEKTGFNFSGWYVENDGIGGSSYPVTYTSTDNKTFDDLATITNPTSDYIFIVLAAEWTPKTYTVQYDINDGTSPLGTPRTGVLWEQAGLVPAPDGTPTYTGNLFMGWNTKANGSGKNVYVGDPYSSLVTDDTETEITLYAQWLPQKTYFVQYHLNGALSPSSIPDNTGVLMGDANLLPNETLYPVVPPVGFEMSGWAVIFNGTKQGVTNTDKFEDLADNPNEGYIILQVQWSPKAHLIVHYDENDGTWLPNTPPGDKTEVVWTQAHLTPLLEPTRTSWVFVGWNTAADGSGVIAGINSTFGELVEYDDNETEVTLYAQWAPTSQYTVRYNVDIGLNSIPNDILFSTSSTVLVPDPGAPPGYSFAYWKVQDNGYNQGTTNSPDGINTTFADLAYPGANYIILVAIYTVNNNYTVTYDFNYLGAPSPEVVSDVSWKQINLVPYPAMQPGFTLLGWTTAPNGGITALPSYTYSTLVGGIETPNVTLYAQWEEASFIVRYDLNGGVTDNPSAYDQRTVGYDDTGLVPPPLSRNGYQMTQWNVSENGFKQDVQNTDRFRDLANVGAQYITLQAQWTEKQYTVIYDENGSSTTYSSQTGVRWWTLVELPTTTPALPYGYASFLGWKLSKIGTTGIDVSSESYVVDKAKKYSDFAETDDGSTSITLQAQYQESADVTIYYETHNLNSGDSNPGGSVDPEDEEVPPATGTPVGSTATANQGYHFIGWYLKDADYTDITDTLSNKEHYVPERNSHEIYEEAIYVAVFDVNTGYTVIYNTDGGTTITDKTVSWTDDVLPANNPTKTHYCLSGWEVIEGGSYSDDDLLEITGDYPYGDIATDDETMSITLKALWSAYELSAPLNDTLCLGGTAILSSTLTGSSENDEYQWQYSADNNTFNDIVDDVPTGAVYTENDNTLEITGLAVGNSYFYRLTVQMDDRECADTSASARVVVIPKPTLTDAKVLNDTICQGGTTTFESNLSGGVGVPTYQWQYNNSGSWTNVGTGIPAGALYTNANSEILQVSGIEDPGVYKYRLTVEMTGSECNAISKMDSVVVIDTPVLSAPTVTNDTICQGGTTSFESNLSGGYGTAAYQWQYFDGDDWDDVEDLTPAGAVYTNANSEILQVTGIENSGVYKYRLTVEMTGSACNTVSEPDSVVVIATPVLSAPTVSDSPICVIVGETTLQSDLTGGVGLPTYQWQYDPAGDGTGWTDIVDGTAAEAEYLNTDTPELTISDVTTAGTYSYRLSVEMTGSACTAYSPAGIFIVDPTSVAGVIDADENKICYATGTQLTLNGYVGTIQWEISTDGDNFTNISGATSATYHTGNLIQNTWYRVTVKSGVCVSETSASILITIDPIAEFNNSSIVTSNIICESQNLYVLPNWNSLITNGYGLWTKLNAQGTLSGRNYTTNGAEEATFIFSIYNNAGSTCATTPVATQIFTLTVQKLPTLTITAKSCNTNISTSPYKVTVEASGGSGNYTVSIYPNIGTLTNNSDDTWTITNIPAGMGIDITVQDDLCSYTLPVTAPNCDCPVIPLPEINASTTITECYDGSIYTGDVGNPDDGLYDIVWYTTQTGTVTTTAPSGSAVGVYTAWAALQNGDGCESTTRVPSTVTILALPTATIASLPTTVCEGEDAEITITLTGTQPWKVTYNDGTNHTISGITTNSYTFFVSPTGNTTYTLVSVSDYNCSNTASGDVTITVDTKAIFNDSGITTSDQICESETDYTLPDWSLNITNGDGEWTISGAAKGTLSGFIYTTNGTETVTFTYSIYSEGACASTTPTLTQNFTLTISELPSLTIREIECYAQNPASDYYVIFEPTGGVSPYTITADIGDMPVEDLDGTWSIINILSGEDITITVKDGLGCENSLTIYAPDCECFSVPTFVTTSITNCLDGNTYTATADNPDENLYEIVWYTTQTGSVTTTAPSRNSVGTSTAWAALKDDAGCESLTRTQASVTILELPTATINGVSTTICKGNSAEIEIELTGTQPWEVVYTDGTDEHTISGITITPYFFSVNPETNTTYSLISVTDNYSCSNAATGAITVSVNPVSVAGTISATDVTICSGTGTTISLSDYVGNIQWQSSTTSSTEGFTNIPVGALNTFSTGNLTQTTWFRAVVQNGVCDAAISDAAQVLVIAQPTLSIPTVSNSPICEDGTTTLSSTLSGGTGTPTYYWQYFDGGWNDIDDGTPTNATYSVDDNEMEVSGIITPGNHQYRLYVSMTGSGCEVYSLPAVITVVPASNTGVISASSTNICAFTETILTLTGYTGTIQWQSSITSATTGFADITGATAPTLATGNLSQTTWYRVIVKNGVCAEETGTAIEITVDPIAGFDGAEIDLQATICESEDEFELPDWEARKVNGSGVWTISGAAKGILTGTTYTTNGAETVIFTYSVYSEGACVDKSPITQNFTLIVEAPPILTLLTKECNTSSYSVTVKASGGSGDYNISATRGILTYASDDTWNITNIPANTDFEITLNNESIFCPYILPVTAPDCDCPVIPLPEINATTIITECYDGNTYTGSVDNPDAGLYVIVWYTTQTGAVTTTAPSGSAVGVYTAWAALQNGDGCESVIRVPSTVTIVKLPTVSITSLPTTVCEGEDAEITITLTGTQPWEVTYNDGTNHTISGITTTPYSFFVSPTGNTTYTLVSVEDALCNNTASGSIAITVDTKAEFDDFGITTSDQICVSETDYTLPDWSPNITNGDGEWTISGAAKGTLSGDTYHTAGVETVTFTYSIYSKNACASTTPTLTQNFTLTIPALPTLTVTEIECDSPSPISDYHVTVKPNGGVLPYNSISADYGTVDDNLDGTWSITDIPSGQNITITVKDNLGCENNITVSAPNCECPVIPSPATNSITRCFDGNTYTATAINPDPDVYEMVWYTTPTGSVTTTAPTRNSVGTTTAWVALKDGAGCQSLIRTQASVTILELPTANIISTSTTICYGNNAEIEIELTGENPWNVVYSDGTNNYPISITATPYLFSVDPEMNTTYSLINVIDNQPCSNTAAGAATISVNPVSVAGTITADAATVCYGTGTNINLSGYVGTIQWQRSITSATLGFTDIPGGTSDLLNTGNLTQTTWFRAIVQSGVCDEKISATVQVTVVPQPTLSIPTISDLPICEGGYTTLSSTLSGGTGTPTYTWQYLDGDWEPISAGTPTEAIYSVVNSAGTSTLNVSEILIEGNYLYRLNVSMSGSGCNVVNSASITITVTPPPFEGNIIADLSNVCYNTGTVLTLEDYFGTIQWQHSTTSATVGFTDISGATSDVLSTGNLTQTTWYRTIITNSVCKPVITTAKEIKVTPITAMALTSAAGTNVQTVRRYADIVAITYSTIPEVSYVITGLPDGVTGSMSLDGIITIAGAPTETGVFDYTITISGYCGTDIRTGSITVKIDCPTEKFDEVNEILYHVVEVAGMCWFKENLSGTKYQNETDIPFAMPYYHTLYPDIEQNMLIFGLLYNYESVFPDPSYRFLPSICPEGWRIPTSAEWMLLNMYNMEDLRNPTYWLYPNNDTDIFKFDARGAGYYNGSTARYEDLYGFTGWWAYDSSLSGETLSMGAVMEYYCNQIEIVEIKKTDALSVRCLYDD